MRFQGLLLVVHACRVGDRDISEQEQPAGRRSSKLEADAGMIAP